MKFVNFCSLFDEGVRFELFEGLERDLVILDIISASESQQLVDSASYFTLCLLELL